MPVTHKLGFLMLLVLLLGDLHASGQAPRVDSLRSVWQDESQPDSSRYKAIHTITWEGYLFSQPDSAYYYAQLHFDRAEDEGNKKQMARALNTQGISYAVRGNYARALDHYTRSLAIGKNIGDQKSVAISLGNIGNIYFQQGDYDQAIDYQTRSLALKKKFGDKRDMAVTLGNIGLIYKEQGDYARSIDYQSRSLALYDEIGDDRGVATSLNNIGLIYFEQEDYEQALDYYTRSLASYKAMDDQYGVASTLGNIGNTYTNKREYKQALDYYTRCLTLRKEIGDLQGSANTLNNIGTIHFQLEDYPRAIDYYVRSLDVRQDIGDQQGAASSLSALAEAYNALNQTERAIDTASRALAIARAIGNVEATRDAAEVLYQAHKAAGQPQQALAHYELFIQMRDSIRSEENQREIIRQEYQYTYQKQALQDSLEFAKQQAVKDLELDNQRVALQRQRLIIGASGLGIILLGGLAFTLVRSNRREKRDRALLGEQKEEIETQRDALQNTLEELQRSQRHIKRQGRKLKVALAQNRAITRALDRSALVAITDLEGRILQVNDPFCQHTGYPQSDLLHQPIQRLQGDHHPPRFWAGLQRALQQGHTWRAEVCSSTRDGQPLWTDLVVNPVLDRNHNIDRFLWVGYVITERKAAEQQIKLQQRALERANLDLRQTHLKITASITYAQRIQEAILPSPARLQHALPQHFVFFRPRDVVSGDFYWLHDQRHLDGNVILAAVDCTGHGVPGAFMSMVGHSLLNYIVKEKGLSRPDLILEQLDLEVRQALNQDETQNQDGMDMALITWNQPRRELLFAGAKNPLLYFQNGQIQQLKGDRRAIGGTGRSKSKPFTCQSLSLDAPISCYLFSDGFQDQFGGQDGKKFMVKNLRETLAAHAGQPMDAQAENLQKVFDHWRGDHLQMDDVLVLGVAFPG